MPEHSSEWGGPVGATGITIMLPLVVYGLYYLCQEDFCLGPDNYAEALSQFPSTLSGLVDLKAILVIVAWLGFQIFLEGVLPGAKVQGLPLRDGTRLTYTMNGHLAFVVSLLSVCIGHWVGLFNLSYCYDSFVQLASASILVVVVLSVGLYVCSFREKVMVALEGDTGNPIYDFFVGRELNPRIGWLDLKCHCELRPGLIGWCILNLGMLAKRYEEHGYMCPFQALVVAFQTLYVWDALYQEQAILSTMDITTDGFGFMLAFGDLTWVPFTYTLQARYLVFSDANLPQWACPLLLAMNMLGYAIFRLSNSQKDAFRRDPKAPGVAHLKSMPTKRGTRLLTSGWWGAARKINYTGDWLMGLTWCMCTGFGCIIPYFYAIYFGILLVHRAFRDDRFCTEKYGEDWSKYKQHVPYVFVPYVI